MYGVATRAQKMLHDCKKMNKFDELVMSGHTLKFTSLSGSYCFALGPFELN